MTRNAGAMRCLGGLRHEGPIVVDVKRPRAAPLGTLAPGSMLLVDRCERCGREVTRAILPRERAEAAMGYLAAARPARPA